jgi:hypothetical protein
MIANNVMKKSMMTIISLRVENEEKMQFTIFFNDFILEMALIGRKALKAFNELKLLS